MVTTAIVDGVVEEVLTSAAGLPRVGSFVQEVLVRETKALIDGSVQEVLVSDTVTVDKLIDFDGFEKYGPTQNINFLAFSTSSSNSNLVINGVVTPMAYQGFLSEWFSLIGNAFAQIGLIQGLNGVGTALAFKNGNFGAISATRNLPKAYSRMILGVGFMVTLVGGTVGFNFNDGLTSTVQSSVWFDTSGRINISRGSVGGGTVLWTSAPCLQPYARHYLEIDISFSSTTGLFKVWLDGLLLTSQTGQNTIQSVNSLTNQFNITVNNTVPGLAIDDMYWRDNTNGTAAPYGDSAVDFVIPASDNSIQFLPDAALLGHWHQAQTTTTNGPGANILVLVPVTPVVNMTVNSIGVFPQSTSLSANFKGVIYSDSSGSPNTLMTTGTQVVGCISTLQMTLPLVTPQALTAGTQYWIGYISDTNITLQISNTINVVGQLKANTYTSGAPAGPLSGMTTGQSTWCIWGNCTGVASNYQNLIGPGAPFIVGQFGPSLSYNESQTVGSRDYFNVTSLPISANVVQAVKVSSLAKRSLAGPRTMNVHVKSSGADSIGTRTGHTPPTSMQWHSSRFDTDPATGAPWTATGVNNMQIGYEVSS